VLDVSALASLDEGFPNSLLEAMAQGVPLMSTRVGGVPDLVSHEVNGLLVPSGDPAAFAHAILRFLREPELAATLALNARRTAESHRSEAVTDALLRTYRAIGRG
ncbi:MAG: glycosyltransferase, partial [Gemmatimonadaceae bacterium]